MPGETKAAVRLEIVHVLFIDIVGYSKLLISEQSELLGTLNNADREAGEFRSAEADGQLVRLPTGDGMALVFRHSPEQPVRCALQISQAIKNYPKLQVRMGIHRGPVNEVADVNERANIAGAGINIAQRVMDCADAGHILLSKHVAEDLQHYLEWRPYLHDVGQCEVKHEEIISIVNFYTKDLGNPNPPRLKRAATEVRRRRRNAFVLAGSGMAALLVVGLFLLPRAFARKIDKSIAVLPFESLSDDKENAYFADGIQDDVLTNLSKISDLKVISRTSVMPYRGKGSNVREIGKALGVATLLEGSVRRVGNRVRVAVQLINTENDEHLWAEDYDRELTDVFAIQTDLARKIASELQAKLSPSEKAQFEIAQSGLPNESDAYLAIGAIQRRQGKWAESTANIEKASNLNPKDPWSLQNLAQNYQVLRNFDAANKTIDRGLNMNPNGVGLWETKSKLAIAEKGDFSVAEKAFAAAKSIPMTNEEKLRIAGARADVFLLERKYQEGLREAESLPDDLFHEFQQHLSGKYFLIGFARKSLQDEAGARAAFLKAKDLLEGQLKGSPDAEDMYIQLAKVLAYLGEKDAALTEARRAPELRPESKDAFGVPENAGGNESAMVDLAIFSAKSCTLRVIDNPTGETLSDTMRREKCAAGVNGGYFSSDFAPIGLLISDGKMIAPLQRARLITGVLSASVRGVQILRVREFSRREKIGAAVQCGPFLVDYCDRVDGLVDSNVA